MLNLFARLTLQSPAPGEGGLSFFLLIGGMFLIMYLFMIRPQVKNKKRPRPSAKA